MRANARSVDGLTVFYSYLQHDLLENDVWLFQSLAAHLMLSLGVWFRPEDYARFPFLARYAVRDVSYRGGGGRDERWGSATPEGLFADDNSLIKGLPRRLNVDSPAARPFRNRSLGGGFVAAHVWGRPDDPLTYSFIPNLVWLPSEVAKLTDRQDSFVQRYVQAISMRLYRDHDVPRGVKGLTTRAWRRLPPPQGIPDQGVPSRDELLVRLNFFRTDSHFFARRLAALRSVVDALDALAAPGADYPSRVISSRYGPTLRSVGASSRRQLRSALRAYLSAAERAVSG